MVQSGVNPVANSMMVGRPGNQQQTTGQGPMGNSPSEYFSEDFYFFQLHACNNLNEFFTVGQMNKAPSAIKTNIKAAAQIHPYR